MRTTDALRYAQERDLDLVEVAPEARPPVCRVLDYSKYKYEQAQKLKQARKHQQQITIREIKFRPKIAENDYKTKKGHVERFLRHKDKVKVTIMFRGREVTHPERGVMILDRLAEELAEIGTVEQRPIQDGRNMTMMLGPSKAVLSGEIAIASKGHDHADEVAAPPRRPLSARPRPPRRPRSRPTARPRRSPRRRPNPRSPARRPRQPRRHRRRTAPPRRARPRPSSTRGPPLAGRRSGSPILARSHAENEDSLRRQEALHEDCDRQGPRSPCLHEPHPREEVRQPQASPRQAGRSCSPKTRSASTSCCGPEARASR